MLAIGDCLLFLTEFVYISIGLTYESLFKRNIAFFGNTNLRATLCYSLVHLAKPQPGDVILDHMCGGASVPIEVSVKATVKW